MPVVQRLWILVQSPAGNGQNVPALGHLQILESSWMSWQTTAASSSQASIGVRSISLLAPGLQPGIALPGEWCKSSAICSYPCLLNGLKTVENRAFSILIIKRVLPIIHSLHTRCYDFWFSCTDHSVHLVADLQVVMVFQKKEEKIPNRKPEQLLSAFQKSKIVINEVIRISHAKAVSRAASVCSS